MIRDLLVTATSAQSVGPLDVGFDFTGSSGNADTGFRAYWSDANPLNASGTITTVRADIDDAGKDIVFFLISPNDVIRSVSGTLTSVANTNTYSVALVGQVGDYIGMWTASTTTGPRLTLSTSGVNVWRTNPGTTAPTAGDTLNRSSTSSNRKHWIYGTN